MYGLASDVKEGLSFAWDLENSSDSYVFNWFYFNQYLDSTDIF